MAQPPGWVPGGDPGASASLSPALAVLLRRWGEPAAAPAQDLAARLGSWLDWRDAIALSQVLAAPAAPSAQRRLQADPVQALERLRSLLQADFQQRTLVQGQADAGAFRLHHQQQQRAMAARIAPLRAALRAQLRDASPPLARLAALDEVFEQALGAREQQGLAALPGLLTRRAAALRAALPDEEGEAADPAGPPRGWRGQLWAELQQALQAELELRLQPLLGLLDALQHEAESRGPSTLSRMP